MISVVGWHCYCGSEIEKYVLPMLFYWAVPWFFVVSGFCLAYSMERKGIIEMIKSKLSRLLIPYLLWSLVGVCVCGMSSCGSVLDMFGIVKERIFPTGNQFLWYLRSVIIFTLAGVGVYSIVPNSRFRLIIVCVLVCALLTMVNYCLFSISTGSSPLYFCSGIALWAVRNCLIVVNKRVAFVLSVTSMMLFLATKFLYFLMGFSSAIPGGTLLTNLSTASFIVGIWFGIGLCSKELKDKICCLNFLHVGAFVYFAHYPVLRKIIDIAQWSCNSAFIVYCFVAPCFFIGCALLIQVTMPRLYRIASGGRV
jgi:fucose 4-O-acetylase-like acetyltransferase